MGIDGIDILIDDEEPRKHKNNCLCKKCIAESEAIFNGTDDVSQNFPDSERNVKDRRSKIKEMPNG